MAATTEENKVKRKIDRELDKLKPDAWFYRPIGSQYQAAVIDYIGVVRGTFVGIEAKRPGAKPTARQQHIIGKMRQAGALVFVIDGDESLLHCITTLQELIHDRRTER